jgi:YVTN family beta-propeller protein
MVFEREFFKLSAVVVAAMLILGGASADGLKESGTADEHLKARLRQPTTLALSKDGRWILSANRRSGSVSLVATQTAKVVAEATVGRSVTDLVALPDGCSFLGVDEDANELLILACTGTSVGVLQRVPVARSPVSVQLARDASWCSVAGLWSRQLTFVDLDPLHYRERGAAKTASVALPFAPRKQLLVQGGRKLLVADSFGGRLAVVDVASHAVEAVHSLPAHNVRGLCLSPEGETVLVAHQILNGTAQSTFDDVHWGNVLTNNLRELSLTQVLSTKSDVLRHSRLHYLGEVGRAAGDPADLTVTADGTLLVALAGVNELLVEGKSPRLQKRLPVGRRPTSVISSPDGRLAYVANTLGDSITVVDLQAAKVKAEIPLGPQPVLQAHERGERLFFDSHLSHDGWLSCHSCHTDGHSNGSLNDNLGDGSFGAPKRVLSLLGARDTGPWAWNGSMTTLEDQVRKSITSTMQGSSPLPSQVQDLAAYLRTLTPPPPLRNGQAALIERGREVFRRRNCVSCHAPPTYTSAKTYDVGLTDEVGNTRFNPPSLRGVGQGGPFFHDGRAARLEEVFTRYRHQLKGDLDKGELNELLGFLESL